MRGWNSQISSTCCVFLLLLVVVLQYFQNFIITYFVCFHPSANNCWATTIIFSFCGEIKLFFYCYECIGDAQPRVKHTYLPYILCGTSSTSMENSNACDWMFNDRSNCIDKSTYRMERVFALHSFVCLASSLLLYRHITKYQVPKQFNLLFTIVRYKNTIQWTAANELSVAWNSRSLWEVNYSEFSTLLLWQFCE